MLARSANGIFWMFRYLERAENTARLLEAGFHMALTRGGNGAEEEWRSVLTTIGQEAGYDAAHDRIDGQAVFNFILRDPANPGRVLAMIEQARSNAREQRTSLTREVWEAINESWMVLKTMLTRPVTETGLGDVLSTIRNQTALVRGAMEGTMLRNPIFNFARAGTFIERADNTARILDVKYYLLLPSVSWVGSSLDNTQWDSVLRSMAGYRAYRWLTGGSLEPRGIAEFLLLDGRFPRSLAFCHNKLAGNLASLQNVVGGDLQSVTMACAARDRLATIGIEGIFDRGLHEFVLDMIDTNRRIAEAVASDFRFVE